MALKLDKGGVVVSDDPDVAYDTPRGYVKRKPKSRFTLDPVSEVGTELHAPYGQFKMDEMDRLAVSKEPIEPETGLKLDVAPRTFGVSGGFDARPKTPIGTPIQWLPGRAADIPFETTKAAGRGLVSGLTRTAGTVGTGLQYVGGKIGLDAMERLGKETYESWEKVGEKYLPPEQLQGSIIDNPALMKKGAWWAYNIAQMSPSLLVSAVPGLAAGKYIKIFGKAVKLSAPVMTRLARLAPALTAGIVGGGLEGSSTYQEILKKGGTKDEAEAGMEMMTLAAGALNAISFNTMLNKVDPGFKKAAIKFVVSGATEGITEWLEEPAEGLIKLKLGYATPKEVWEQTRQGLNVAPIAAITGGVGSIVFSNLPGIEEEIKLPDEKKSITSLLDDLEAIEGDENKQEVLEKINLMVKEKEVEVVPEPVAEPEAAKEKFEKQIEISTAGLPIEEEITKELKKPPEITEVTPTIPEEEIAPEKRVTRAPEVKKEKVEVAVEKETVITKIKKYGKTYDLVRKADKTLELRHKKSGDVIPYSEEELIAHEKRGEAGRKGLATRIKDKQVYNPKAFGNSPALSFLIGKGMSLRGRANELKPLGELVDLWDGILIGTNAINAKPPMKADQVINRDLELEHFNDSMDYVENEKLKSFFDIVDMARDELVNFTGEVPLLTEQADIAEASSLELTDEQYIEYKKAETQEEKMTILDEAYKYQIMDALDITEEEYGAYTKLNPEQQETYYDSRAKAIKRDKTETDEAVHEVGDSLVEAEKQRTGLSEKELDKNLKDVMDFFEAKSKEPSQVSPEAVKKLKADKTEVMFDTKDAKTGEPIKAGEVVWRLVETGEFIKDSTFKNIIEVPEQEALFAEEVAKRAVEKKVTPPKEPVERPVIPEGTIKQPTVQITMMDELEGKIDMFKEQERLTREEKAQLGEKGALRVGREETKEPSKFKFSDEETERRYQQSKGLTPEKFLDRIKNNLEGFWHKLTREYEHLPRTKEFAQVRFDLLKLSKQKGVVSDKTVRVLNEITKYLSKDEYDIFNRKVIVDDLLEMAKEEKELPYGFEEASLKADSKELNSHVNDNIKDAIERRDVAWKQLKTDYIEVMKSIGYDVSEKMTRKNYFRHQVLDYARMQTILGAGKRLKTPTGRGFLKERKGSKLDINADYLQAEHEVMAQMNYDIQVAEVIKAVDNNNNIANERSKIGNELRKEAKKQKTDWHNLIPEGYTEWQPREGNVFYLTDTIPAKLAEQLASGMIERLGISKEQVSKALTMGGKRKEFIIKEEIALTLDNLVKDRSPNAISEAHKNIITKWKQWQLVSPRRVFKYNIRNLTGDADAAFLGNPSTFLKVPGAIKELYAVYGTDKILAGNIKDWFERGGTISTLQAQEMDDLNNFNTFIGLRKDIKTGEVPKEIWKKYWEKARISTDFRESILRYAAYIDYLEQMQKNPDGKPNNFGASKSEEIMGLEDIKDRAYWLSNDLLGAYDKVSVYGQFLREHIIPFWSWKEVNFKRYIQMFRNAASDENLAKAVGRKTLGTIATTPYKIYRIGKFVIMANAFLAMTQIWNKMIMGDDDDELPEDVRTRPHITLGKDRAGNVIYFTRIGALGDLLEWGNLDASPFYIDQFRKEKMSIKEIAKDMAKAPANVFMQGVEPFTKTVAELITRRALYPDLFKPSTIRDRGLHLARNFGIADEYIALTGKPSRGYLETIPKLLIYKSDPLESAYWDILNEKRRFLKTKGKIYEGFMLTPRGNALYNIKRALRFKDEKSGYKYLQEYIKLGGTEQGIRQSFRMMTPVYGIKDKKELAEFATYLGKDGLDKMAKALVYYDKLLNSKKEED